MALERVSPRPSALRTSSSRGGEVLPAALAADQAFRAFCYPPGRWASNHQALARRARFHLRHARAVFQDGLAVYCFEPANISGGTVLLIHGWSAEGSSMAAFAEPLRRAGHRAIIFDLPAHGRSQGKYTNLAACARAAHRIASDFGPLRAVIGHSLGALISLWIAEGGPPLPSAIPVSKIALLACPNRFAAVARDFGRNFGLGAPSQRAFEQRVSRAGRRPIETFSAVSLLPRIASDILVVHSTDDKETSFEDAKAIAAAYPRAKFLPCTGLGHTKLLYDPPVIRSVAAFIEAGQGS